MDTFDLKDFTNIIIYNNREGIFVETKFRKSTGVGIRTLTYVGIMAAMTFVLAYTIHLNTFMGVVHLGDSMVLLGAILLGKKKGAASAAIGMTLFDLLLGYTMWAPFTFVIKASMAYIAASIAFRKDFNGENIINNTFAFVVAALFMIFGYFLAGGIIAKLTMEAPTLFAALALSSKDIVGNIGQGTAAIVIALPLSKILKNKIKI
jgi:uncharacterized membrane protein